MRVLHSDLFEGLSESNARDFAAIETRVFYPPDSGLFRADQDAFAVFVIHGGSVAVSPAIAEDRPADFTAAVAGEILGLSATMAGEPYQVSACALEFSDIGLVSRDDLLKFLATHSDFAFALVRLLSDSLCNALDHLRALPPAIQA
jgi:CRP-like cAMP-binding protein